MRKAQLGSRALRGAVGLGVAVASLAFAGVAGASVQVISPDQPVNGSCPASPPTSSTLSTAIATANGNSDASNTIVLTPGIYCPVFPTGQTTITISKNLNIVADHSFQNTQGDFNLAIEGTDVSQNPTPMFTVPSGVTLRMDGSDVVGDQNAGSTGTINVETGGALTTYGETFIGNGGGATLFGQAGSTMNINESNVNQNLTGGIQSSGAVNLQNVTLYNNSFNLDILSGSTFDAFNTLIVDANIGPGFDCENGKIANANNNSMDDDGSCGVQFSDNTDIDTHLGINATNFGTGQDGNWGGPTTTVDIEPNPDTSLKGVNCPPIDGRFYVNPVSGGVIQCDIGADTGGYPSPFGTAGNTAFANSATQETTGPSCKVTGGTVGVSQNVTLADSGSGFGPEAGLQTDNPSNTVATAYPPPAAVPVPGNDVTNLQINNGSVTFTSPTAPTTSPIVLTAGNKTTAGVNNSNWSFTGLNWAGVATNCF